jgi:C-terminal domain of 1-Cys peroxiredoxin
VNDLPVRRSVDEALCLLQAFQFTVTPIRTFLRLEVDGGADVVQCSKDKHGEMCPQNWKEGRKTIQADRTAKLEYFAAVDRAQENGKVIETKHTHVD